MTDRLESLIGLAARVTAADTESAVLVAIVEEGAEVAGANAAVVGLVEGDAIRVAAERGYPPGYLEPWRTFPLEAGSPMADVIMSGQPVYCASREERDERWPSFRGTGVDGSQAFAVLPLAGLRGTLGALTLTYLDEREFDLNERRFFEAFSAHCAVTLERTRAASRERSLNNWFAFISETGKALSSSLDYEETLAAVGRLLVPQLADWFAVDLLAEDNVQLVAVSHVNPGKARWAWGLRELAPIDMDATTGLPNVLRTGQSELYEEITDDMIQAAATTPQELEVLREIGFSSAIIVPLKSRGRVLGALTLVWAESGRHYDQGDLQRAKELAGMVASAIDNAQLYGAQLAGYQRERIARERTERLQRFTERLAPALTVESVVEITIDKALVAAHGTTALLGLASKDGKVIHLTVGGEHQAELAKHNFVPIDHRSAFADVFRRREPLWLSERRQWDEYPDAIGRLPTVQAVAIMPIETAGRFFGVLEITFDREREFLVEERAFLLAIARQAAQALDRARLYEEQSHIAHVLQQSLLPQTLPEIPGVEVAATYRAAGRVAEIGGDFYDVFEAADGYVVAIGDVCGKGPVAATLTALCRYTLRASALRSDHARPAELLSLLNRAIFAEASGRVESDTMFASVTCVFLKRLAEGELTATIASGGHPPTLIRRRAGEVEDHQPTGPLVGIRDDATFDEYRLELHPGDVMLLHTDGLTDARREDGDRIGSDRVRQTVAAIANLEHASDATTAFDRMLDGVEITDDVAVVAMRVR